jgi:hypothetical protein
MEWISVKTRLPDSTFEGKNILVLVNGRIFLSEVVHPSAIFLTDNRFIFSLHYKKWKSDNRFATPTHWMELPEPPKD